MLGHGDRVALGVVGETHDQGVADFVVDIGHSAWGCAGVGFDCDTVIIIVSILYTKTVAIPILGTAHIGTPKKPGDKRKVAINL